MSISDLLSKPGRPEAGRRSTCLCENVSPVVKCTRKSCGKSADFGMRKHEVGLVHIILVFSTPKREDSGQWESL